MAETEFALEGGCDCGAVRYRLLDAPMFVHCCHCRWCQRESGAAFTLNALLETACVQLLHGAPECIDTPSASGKGQKILRCPTCKVALWSHYAGGGEAMAFVRIGTLDEPARCPPGAHIYASSKLPWVSLPADVPAFDAYYDPRLYWPQASQCRWRALMKKDAG